MRLKVYYLAFCIGAFFLMTRETQAQEKPVGIFDGQNDVGLVKHQGNGVYDYGLQQYRLTGSGSNIWANHDEFHFVWKRMRGNFILRANASFIGKGVEEHRKIGWMVRTSLDTNSKHISAVGHGNGLTSLQYRSKESGVTAEKQFKITTTDDVIQLERKNGVYTMSVAKLGETFVSEKIDSLDLGDDVYVGLFICSHNPNVVEKATFNNVRIVVPAPKTLV